MTKESPGQALRDDVLHSQVIHPVYLPCTAEELAGHFPGDPSRPLEYFRRAVDRYTAFFAGSEDPAHAPLSAARRARKIEQDERFWTTAALKVLFDHPQRHQHLTALLRSTFGARPPLREPATWADCLSGRLRLWFEVPHASPPAYLRWLAGNLQQRHFVPHALDAARRGSRRPLEPPTLLSAVLLNEDNGFSLALYARVLGDSTADATFDCLRNQLTRAIDVLLEAPDPDGVLAARRPDRTLFGLLTPQLFQQYPDSRHYAALIIEYMSGTAALARDLPHRDAGQLRGLPARLGWLTFEGIAARVPRACPWLHGGAAAPP